MDVGFVFERLSEADRETVRGALAQSFGTTAVGAVRRLTGGISAASFRIEIGPRAFLLRLEGPPGPLRNPHQYEALRIAAAAGVAPRIHYLDEAGRIVILDCIETRPLDSYPGGPPALVQGLGELLARLQRTAPFPHFVDYPDIVGRLFAHVRRTGLFADDLLNPHVERLEALRRDYFANALEPVSSHNDCHPGNILFDGERLWLVDWESAYRNDPLIDLAIMIDSFPLSAELQSTLLQAWLGRTPGVALHSRLATVRALVRLYFAGVFLSGSAAGNWRHAPDKDLSVPTLADYQRAIGNGRLQRGTPEARHVLGKMFLASFLSGSPTPGFLGAV